jgi:hypothetical protein
MVNVPVTIFWGTRRLSTNAGWYNDFKKHSQSAKGKGGGAKGGKVYDYTAATILLLSEGTIDYIQNVWASGSTTTTTSLSALNMTFFNGSATQTPWSFVTSKYPAQARSYALTSYLACPKLDLGESASIPDNAFECVRTAGFSYTHSTDGWINPATHDVSPAVDVLISDCITDLLTNVQYGFGFSTDDIGDITQFATYQRAQGLFFSPLLNSQTKVTDIFNRWAQMANGWIFWSGTRLEFVPLGDSAVTGNGVTYTPQIDVAYDLGPDDFLSDGSSPRIKVSRKDPADCYNHTQINITDRTQGYIDNPFPYQDDQLVDQYGRRDNTSIEGDDCCDPAVARIIVQLAGKRAAYIRNTYAFKTAHRFIRCLPGSVLTLTEPNIGMDHLRVRVTDIGEDTEGKLTFTCEEFPGTIGTYVAPLAVSAINTPTTPNLYVVPGPVNTPAIIEPDSAFTGGVPKIVIAASGGENWGGCNVHLSFDGTSYSQIGTITNAAVQGVLTAGLATSGANPDTSHTLSVDCTQSLGSPVPVSHDDADELRTLSLIAPQPTISGSAYIVPTNGELLAFGDVATTGTYSADLSYLQRGQYGTAVGAHSAGDQFTLIDVLGTDGSTVAYDIPAAYIGKTLYLKLASFNMFELSGEDLSVVAEYQYSPTGAGFGSAGSGMPATPTGFAGLPGPAQAALQWNANPTADNVTAYRVLRAAGSGASFASATEIWQGQALNLVDTTTSGSAAYTYFLEALNAVGSSVHTSGLNVTTNASGSIPTGSFVFNETPAGAINGTNAAFVLAHAPVSGNLILSKNGTILVPVTDYTLSGNTITMTTAPTSGSILLATYMIA